MTVTVAQTEGPIDATLAVAGAISGKVTNTALGNYFSVYAYSESLGVSETTGPEPDGSYIVRNLAAADDYRVCVTYWSEGGTGWVEQCYKNESASGTWTPVEVTLAKTMPDIDMALVAAP